MVTEKIVDFVFFPFTTGHDDDHRHRLLTAVYFPVNLWEKHNEVDCKCLFLLAYISCVEFINYTVDYPNAESHEEMRNIKTISTDTQTLQDKAQELDKQLKKVMEDKEESDKQLKKVKEESDKQLKKVKEESDKQLKKVKEESDKQLKKVKEESDKQLKKVMEENFATKLWTTITYLWFNTTQGNSTS